MYIANRFTLQKNTEKKLSNFEDSDHHQKLITPNYNTSSQASNPSPNNLEEPKIVYYTDWIYNNDVISKLFCNKFNSLNFLLLLIRIFLGG